MSRVQVSVPLDSWTEERGHTQQNNRLRVDS